jgi:hypothetical protein
MEGDITEIRSDHRRHFAALGTRGVPIARAGHQADGLKLAETAARDDRMLTQIQQLEHRPANQREGL